MADAEEAPVLVEVRGRVLIVTLNRPHARNAATQAMAVAVAAAMDRLDADDALTVGIIAGAGGSFCAGMDLKGFARGERPSLPGRGFAALTGAFLTAARACELGLVNRLTDGPALHGALALAEEIDANAPLAVRASKRVIVKSRLWDAYAMWALQDAIMDPVFGSDDAREGAAAFAEKRAAAWTGR